MSEALTPAAPRLLPPPRAWRPVSPAAVEPAWLGERPQSLQRGGQYLAYHDGDELVVAPVTQEWTRVGPQPGRRHPLRRPDRLAPSRADRAPAPTASGVLDDRSLNGVFVNGERVEWSTLRDGDEILVGRHELRFIDVVAVARGARLAPRPLPS